jgi:hypothetical protein
MSGPVISSIASRGMPPSRNRRVPSGPGARMVDSTPTVQGPASRMASTAPPRPSCTWAAVVALIRPEGLAEGAASGNTGLLQQRLHHRVRGDAYGDTGEPCGDRRR